jgi:nucleolar complex protein 2
VVELLAEHLAHWSYSPAFPELSLLPVLNLRRFAKTTKVDKFRKAVKALLDTIEK